MFQILFRKGEKRRREEVSRSSSFSLPARSRPYFLLRASCPSRYIALHSVSLTKTSRKLNALLSIEVLSRGCLCFLEGFGRVSWSAGCCPRTSLPLFSDRTVAVELVAPRGTMPTTPRRKKSDHRSTKMSVPRTEL